jgi:hypothetical protein
MAQQFSFELRNNAISPPPPPNLSQSPRPQQLLQWEEGINAPPHCRSCDDHRHGCNNCHNDRKVRAMSPHCRGASHGGGSDCGGNRSGNDGLRRRHPSHNCLHSCLRSLACSDNEDYDNVSWGDNSHLGGMTIVAIILIAIPLPLQGHQPRQRR